MVLPNEDPSPPPSVRPYPTLLDQEALDLAADFQASRLTQSHFTLSVECNNCKKVYFTFKGHWPDIEPGGEFYLAGLVHAARCADCEIGPHC